MERLDVCLLTPHWALGGLAMVSLRESFNNCLLIYDSIAGLLNANLVGFQSQVL